MNEHADVIKSIREEHRRSMNRLHRKKEEAWNLYTRHPWQQKKLEDSLQHPRQEHWHAADRGGPQRAWWVSR